MPPPALRTLTATRYVSPFREGGSLPGLIEADDGGLYVAKWRGAGQGTRALIAELVAGELARALGLPVPELVLLELDPAFGRSEPDSEIRELLRASAGSNLALAFVPAALGFDTATRVAVPGALASLVVAFDAFVMNVDRTPRNPNLLWSGGALWLIDHGAALYFHHDWDGSTAGSDRPFVQIRDHVLLRAADDLTGAGQTLAARLTDDVLARVCDLIPADWFVPTAGPNDAAAERAAYVGNLRAYLSARLAARARFIEEAIRARSAAV